MTRKEAKAILIVLLALAALVFTVYLAEYIQMERIQDRIDNHSEIPADGEN